MVNSINDFKANLIGGGARANQFKITINKPTGIRLDGFDSRRTSFLVTAAALPDTAMNFFSVPFRGRSIQYPGDRPEPGDWSTTFYNDTDFMIRNAMEQWSNGINDFENNTGVVRPSEFQTTLEIDQLDRDDRVLKSYELINCFPTTISSIELTTAAQDAIETFTVAWKYTHIRSSGVSTGFGGRTGSVVS
jgi:hypothetical protein